MTLGGFDCLVTMDRGLRHQQNLDRFTITIVLLRGINNKLETLRALVPKALEALREEAPPIGLIEIN